MATFSIVAIFCAVVWTVHAALLDQQSRTSEPDPQVERFLMMLAQIRAYLSVWHVSPRV